MSSRFFAIGAVGVLTAITAASAVGPGQLIRLHAHASGASRLHVAGNRSPQQGAAAPSSKFDGALAEISRHVRSEHPGARDLHILNPAAKFALPANSSVPLVSIDAVTRGDPEQLKAALVGLGLQHASAYSNDVGGWLPVDQLDAAAALTEVHAIRAAIMRTKSGAVTSQGDYVQNSDLVRSQNALSGGGVTVGIISDSYDCYSVYAANGVPASGNTGYAYNGFTADAATDISTGDLPSNVTVLAEAQHGDGGCMNYGAPTQLPFGDEGRAMMQIVHDVAPGAALAFYTAENSEADFANGIGALANAGAKVIADDVGYFDEPFFQDGIVAQAIDAVQAQGVAYFSAAGNDGTMAYDNNSPSFAMAGSGPNANEQLLTFGTSGGTAVTKLPVTIPPMAPGEFVAIVLQWDQPYVTGAAGSGGATNRLDLCIENAVGNDIISNYNEQTAVCSGPNAIGADPYQVMFIDNPANAAGNSQQETLNIVVGLAAGAAPGRIKVVVEDDGLGSTINQFATNSGTIQGHPNATGALAVGAAFFLDTPGCSTSPAVLESYSSVGGDPILFDFNGHAQTAVYRQKPDLVGPDGGSDTFLGFTLASVPITDNSTIAGCKNSASFPNFFGTSAATPHVASVAALLLQADPSLTPAQIFTIFRTSTLPMGTVPNYSSGYGFFQADLAAAATPAVVPATPTLTLGSSSITMGGSTTLTWSSANNQGCTAGGTSTSWTGAQASSGSQTVSPTATGTVTYTLYCTNVAGASPTASIMLTVSAASSGGSSGGGALGVYSLLGLMGLCVARLRRSLRVARDPKIAVT